MIYLWATLLLAVNAVWVLLTLLMLPGNWMMVATTVAVGWWQWEEGMFSPWTLVAIVVLAAMGEVVEFLASAVGVRKAGGTRWAGAASLVGAVVGAIPGTVLIPLPVAGSLVGACAGACIGAWTIELAAGRGIRRSVKPALAAGAGRLVGTLGKFIIGVAIWIVIAVAAFYP